MGQGDGERCFHVFYQLISGADADMKGEDGSTVLLPSLLCGGRNEEHVHVLKFCLPFPALFSFSLIPASSFHSSISLLYYISSLLSSFIISPFFLSFSSPSLSAPSSPLPLPPPLPLLSLSLSLSLCLLLSLPPLPLVRNPGDS